MHWACKLYTFEISSKAELLKHCRSHRSHGGQPLPCPHLDCCCSFETWGSLRLYLSRKHSTQERVRSSEILCSFLLPVLQCMHSLHRLVNICKTKNLSPVFSKSSLVLMTLEEMMVMWENCPSWLKETWIFVHTFWIVATHVNPSPSRITFPLSIMVPR